MVRITDPIARQELQFEIGIDLDNPTESQSLKIVSEMLEVIYIQRILKRCNNDLPKTLKALNISQATYYRKVAAVRYHQSQKFTTVIAQEIA